MNISDLLASLASGKGVGGFSITPGQPAMDITQLVSQIGQGGPQAPMPMAPALSPPQPQALPGAPVAAMNLGGQPNDAQTGGGYMNLGSGLAANLPKSPLPPPETEPTAPKSTAPITTGSIAPSTPAPSGLGATQMPDFSHSFGEGLINVGNALQGKTVEDLNADTQSKNLTYQALIKKGIDPTTAEALVRNPSLMKAAVPTVFGGGKYGRQGTVFQDPASGQFFTAQFAEDGTRRILPLTVDGTALEPSRGVKTVDTGLGTRVINGATGGDLREIPKDVSGEANARKTGAGMAERALGQPQAQFALKDALSNLDRLKQTATELRDSKGLPGITGYSGMFPNFPGGAAADAQATLTTLKSQVGFSVLQAMREASKTGGALGNVSEMENVYLQNNLAALEKAQSVEQFQKALNKIITYVDGAKGRLQGAYDQTYGSAPVPSSSPITSPDASGTPNSPKMISPEEAQKLPPGTPFIGLDGKQRVRQ